MLGRSQASMGVVATDLDNDGACALLIASEAAAGRYGLTPLARVVVV